jgi:hypothetical protein
MASILTENCQAGDEVILNDIIDKAYPGYKNMTASQLLTKMCQDGTIHVESLFEKALERKGKFRREHAHGQDFCDGSDAKKAVTTLTVNRKGNTVWVSRTAKVANLIAKSGYLRVIVGDAVSKNTYYFKIPHSAYKGKKSIKISFSEHGMPDGSKWFDYSVKSFKELCS